MTAFYIDPVKSRFFSKESAVYKHFTDTVEISKIKKLFDRQIRYNMDIAYEGISGNWGLGIGRMIRASYADGVVTRMKAYAAAASEARRCSRVFLIFS